MNLQPLTPVAPNSAAASLRVTCYQCRAQSRYDDATAAGWKHDPSGPAFLAFYCPTCATKETAP